MTDLCTQSVGRVSILLKVCVAVSVCVSVTADDVQTFLSPEYQPLGLNVSSEPHVRVRRQTFVALRQVAGV